MFFFECRWITLLYRFWYFLNPNITFIKTFSLYYQSSTLYSKWSGYPDYLRQALKKSDVGLECLRPKKEMVDGDHAVEVLVIGNKPPFPPVSMVFCNSLLFFLICSKWKSWNSLSLGSEPGGADPVKYFKSLYFLMFKYKII
jgi:hypothetical protein